MISEDFLHYVWKYQKWKNSNLSTIDGLPIVVFETGFHNNNSGPDFEQARLKIGDIEWVGCVEIHVKSSDWNRHLHTSDPAYHNVILHVVYQHDVSITINNYTVPTLELKHLIDPSLISSYQNHINNPGSIACNKQLTERFDLSYVSMLEKVLVERLEEKAESVQEVLKANKNDWEATAFQIVTRSFGFSVNKSVFTQLAKRLPYDILKKNFCNQFKTEALLFGQSGFLTEEKDTYQIALKKEYDYLSVKYQLPPSLHKHEWKFGKMRPANFPTVRLSQLAGFLAYNPKLFHLLIDEKDPIQLVNQLKFEVSDYWKKNYDFGKPRKRSSFTIGKTSFEALVINSVVPILAAYSKYSGNVGFMDRAMSILETLQAEQNSITEQWKNLNRKPNSALESQAQIQLLNEYCKKRKCLSCAIGISIINND